MDIMSAKWLSELGMEDTIFVDQCPMNPLDEFNYQSFSSETFSSDPNFYPMATPIFSARARGSSIQSVEKPAKQFLQTPGTWNSCTTQQKAPRPSSSTCTHIISFGNMNSASDNLDCTMKPKEKTVSQGNMDFSYSFPQGFRDNENYSPNSGQETRRIGTMTRNPLHSIDHALAERKRREKVSLRFIALSALLPGLKKMDKASVLGDAVKYLKHLQEHVKMLEEQVAKKTMESVVSVKRSWLYADNDATSSDENFVNRSGKPLPEIEARVSNKDVLIRIHCEKHEGFIAKILSEIEKLHLTITHSSVLPFGNYTMVITVVAQMNVEFCMTLMDIVRNLRQAFLSPCEMQNQVSLCSS